MTTVEKKRTLVVHDVEPEDAGEYVCEVGPRRTTAKVEVLKPEEKGTLFQLYSECAWFIPLSPYKQANYLKIYHGVC